MDSDEQNDTGIQAALLAIASAVSGKLPITNCKLVIIPVATLGSTGIKTITGVGFRPRMIFFNGLLVSASRLYQATGGADENGTQYATSVIANSTAWKSISSKTECMIAMDNAGTQNFSMSFLSMEDDGFKINVGILGNFEIAAFCYA